MKTVKEYCELLQWSISELARRAGLSWEPVSRAYYQQSTSYRTKFEICKAISKELGHAVQVHEVEWEKE